MNMFLIYSIKPSGLDVRLKAYFFKKRRCAEFE